jgi:hypothetical protein
MISFDSLPTRPARQNIAEGFYYAKIETAEMRQPQDPTKPEYLNIMFSLSDAKHQAAGKIYDRITESDSQYQQYKLRRFIDALGLAEALKSAGNFELKDLCKIIKNKELIVELVQEKDKQTKEPTGQTVVNIFGDYIYASLAEAQEIFAEESLTTLTVIDEPDASDATTVSPSTEVHTNTEDDIF